MCLKDQKERIGRFRGRLRKKEWIHQGDVVLLETREYDRNKVDIMHRYTVEEVKQLQMSNQIPMNINSLESNATLALEENGFLFVKEAEVKVKKKSIEYAQIYEQKYVSDSDDSSFD